MYGIYLSIFVINIFQNINHNILKNIMINIFQNIMINIFQNIMINILKLNYFNYFIFNYFIPLHTGIPNINDAHSKLSPYS